MTEIVCHISRSHQRVLEGGVQSFVEGRYKSAPNSRFIRKRVAALRRKRAIYDVGEGYVDFGPAYSRVEVREVERP